MKKGERERDTHSLSLSSLDYSQLSRLFAYIYSGCARDREQDTLRNHIPGLCAVRPLSPRDRVYVAQREVTGGASFLMTAFILGAWPGVRGPWMRGSALTCRAALIANRFIGRTILLEFNAILYAPVVDRARARATRRFDRSRRRRRTSRAIILTRYFPHVDPAFINVALPYCRRLHKSSVPRTICIERRSQILTLCPNKIISQTIL